jgi:hypothetical protein
MRRRSIPLRVATIAASAALAVGIGGALASGFAVAAPGVAGAATVSATVPYSCSFPVLGAENINIGIAATAPSSVTPSSAFSLTDVQSKTVIPSTLVDLFIAGLGVKTLGGTVTSFALTETGGTPASVNAAASPDTFSVPITQNNPATIVVPKSPITVSGFTAGSSGTVVIKPGEIEIKAVISKTTYTIPCTPTSVPAAATLSIAISAAAVTTTTTATVPSTHTGEPFSGWPYWALVGIAGLLGVFSIERAARVRRSRA